MRKKGGAHKAFTVPQISRIIQLEDQMSRDPGNEEKSKELVMLYAVTLTRS